MDDIEENSLGEEEEESTDNSGRAKRVRIPAQRLTYDELGVPSSVDMVGEIKVGQNPDTVDVKVISAVGNQTVDTCLTDRRYDSFTTPATAGSHVFVPTNVSVMTDRSSTTDYVSVPSVVQPNVSVLSDNSVTGHVFVQPVQYVPEVRGNVVVSSSHSSAGVADGTTYGWDANTRLNVPESQMWNCGPVPESQMMWNCGPVPESQIMWNGGTVSESQMIGNVGHVNETHQNYRQTVDLTGQLFAYVPELYSYPYPSVGTYQGYETHYTPWKN